MSSGQRLKRVGLASMSALLLACSGAPVGEEIESSRSALVASQANVFGFEDTAQWTSSVAVSSSTTHTQGSKSLGVKAKGYVEVSSVALSSLTGVTSMIGFDMLLPTAQGNPFWYGFVQVLVSVPSKGVSNFFVGQQELTGKPLNKFFPIDFTLPQSLITTLQAGGYSDCKVKIVLNVPSNETGTYLIDNLHFLAGAVGSADLVETNVLTRWTSGANPTANTTLSVLGAGQTYLGQAALRAVTDAGFDFWLRYDAAAPIDIGTNQYLRFVIRALNTNSGWQQGPVLVVEDATGARMTLDPGATLLPTDGTTWAEFRAPLAGSVDWIRSGAAVDLHKVRAIEIHMDTWDAGFTVDLDAVEFTKLFDTCAGTPATISPTATARATTATVTYAAVAGAVGYNIYRMPSGGASVFVNRARGTSFEDSGLSLNTTYRYEVRAFMPSGCENGSGVATVTTAGSATGLTRVPTLNVLVPIYINAISPYTPTDIAKIKAGIELARQFYFRATKGRINLALDYIEINAPTPDTAGPTMSNISSDLSGRGIANDQYDGVFPVAQDLNGCWGGFVILGHTAGAFGTACGVPYPTNDPNVNKDIIWDFTHEFQHAMDFVITQNSGQDMIHGHPDSVFGDLPYTGPAIDAGEHYDWEWNTLRTFTAYNTLAAPFNDYLEVVDPDGDGLATTDARMPIDEARFGTRADLADTDGDGLNDLAEYYAGMFGSSNPLVTDTDGDGQRDGVDPTPRAAIAASMTAATPVIDGVRDAGYTLFRNGIEFSNVAGFTAATYMAYDANAVYFYIEESQAATLYLTMDGSGASGFFAGDDSYAFTMTPGTSAVLNWTTRHGGADAGAAIPGSQFTSRTVGATTIMEVKIPRTGLGQGYGWTGSTTNGFTSNLLGLRIVFTNFGNGELFGEPWATQNEYFHFDDVTLR